MQTSGIFSGGAEQTMHLTLLRSRAFCVGRPLDCFTVGGVDSSALAAHLIFVFGRQSEVEA